MHVAWLILGFTIGIALGFVRRARHCRGAHPRWGDHPEAANEVRQELGRVRAGIARQHCELDATISQIEEILAQAEVQPISVMLRTRLAAAKKSLASCLAEIYDDLRKVANTDGRRHETQCAADRAALEKFVHELIAFHQRYRNPFSVVMFYVEADVDHATLLERSNQLIRVTDRNFLMGASEVVVVLPETNLHGAQVFAERGASHLTNALGAQTFAGVAAACDRDSARTIINRADTALYRAKSDEKHCVFVHDGAALEARPAELMEV